jgi:hypothetical protein
MYNVHVHIHKVDERIGGCGGGGGVVCVSYGGFVGKGLFQGMKVRLQVPTYSAF